MTVLEKKAASGVEGKKLGRYLGVAVLAGAIGVAAAIGFTNAVEFDDLSPSQIAQIRAGDQVDYQYNQWLARVEATRSAEQIGRFEGAFMANVARIQTQRAADMVEHYTNQNSARAAGIAEQRAADMVEFKYGWGESTDR